MLPITGSRPRLDHAWAAIQSTDTGRLHACPDYNRALAKPRPRHFHGAAHTQSLRTNTNSSLAALGGVCQPSTAAQKARGAFARRHPPSRRNVWRRTPLRVAPESEISLDSQGDASEGWIENPGLPESHIGPTFAECALSPAAEQVMFQSLVSVFKQRLRQKGVACTLERGVDGHCFYSFGSPHQLPQECKETTI